MAKKTKWEDESFSPANVLNHSLCLRIKRFTNQDLDELADCDDIYELDLERSVPGEVIDFAKLCHIRSLATLHLKRVKFKNLHLLHALPRLRFLTVEAVELGDFSAFNGWSTLTTFFVRRCKLKTFPVGLSLPNLNHLSLSNNDISDLRFAASYPTLRSLDLDHNPINDLSTLADCDWLEHLSLTHTFVQALEPIKHFKRLTRLSLSAALTPQGNTLLQPDVQDDPCLAHNVRTRETMRVAALIRQGDWANLYAINDLEVLASAFGWVFHEDMNRDMLQGVLAHPAPGVFQAAVNAGLDAHYRSAVEATLEGFSALGEQLIRPLMAAFHHHLNRPGLYGEFQVGKLKRPHFVIAQLTRAHSGPAYTNLYLAFLNERENFSALHLTLYRHLLDDIGKTEAEELVEPIIDLLRFEKRVIGGDNVLLKRAFKSIGHLGKQRHAPLLEAGFDLGTEEREDVRDAYSAAIQCLNRSAT